MTLEETSGLSRSPRCGFILSPRMPGCSAGPYTSSCDSSCTCVTREEKTIGCQCNSPGFCERHKMTKTPHLHHLCRTSKEYWDLWESGQGRAEAAGAAAFLPTSCQHRGPISRQERCKSCGQRDVLANVYYCRALGECTEHAHGLRRGEGTDRQLLPVCAFCQQFDLTPPGEPIIVEDGTCLGDLTVLSAALLALAEQYPGRFRVLVRSNHPYLFEGSDFARGISMAADIPQEWQLARRIAAHCDPDRWTKRGDLGASINYSNQRPRHFVDAYCDSLAASLALPGPLVCRDWSRPSVRLTLEEKGWLSQVHTPEDQRPFWLVNAGWKSDYPAKRWDGFAEVVRLTSHLVRWVQIGAAADNHPELPGVWRDLRGQTDGRQLVRLVYWASGVLCGVTGLAHLAHWIERRDGLARPAVVVAGGREPPQWFQYPQQTTFSTIGQLDCCQFGGCWVSWVAPGQQGDGFCKRPTGYGVGECMRSIYPETVAAKVQQLALATV